MKILNLYACLGGNRYKWNEVSDDIEVTAVELDKELAKLYQERFPNDKVVVADAHQYLLENFKDFDFIWASPPCPTHSRARYWGHGKNEGGAIYPDMKLYQEVLFLKHYFDGKYCVENVVPYYNPLIPGNKRGRHIYWTNFRLPYKLTARKFEDFGITKNEIQNLSIFHDFDFRKYKGSQRRDKVARNLVDYEAGRTILETALNIQKANNVRQVSIF